MLTTTWIPWNVSVGGENHNDREYKVKDLSQADFGRIGIELAKRDEGIKLVDEAICAGIFNDLGSRSTVDVCLITKASLLISLALDIGETKTKKYVSDMPEEVTEVSGFNYESSEHSSSERWLKTSKIAPCMQLDIQSELANPKPLGKRTPEADEEHQALQPPALPLPNIEKTYIVTRRKEKLSSVLLPLSAASYYNEVSPEMDQSC
ncbi:Nucleophile aminohydrolase, N-terminal [Sesbania bispinosa]|nr:Nucleophile aminohydrolase, N-terminal [Sesbania bispinosa]